MDNIVMPTSKLVKPVGLGTTVISKSRIDWTVVLLRN
jgi:hypothetical protein